MPGVVLNDISYYASVGLPRYGTPVLLYRASEAQPGHPRGWYTLKIVKLEYLTPKPAAFPFCCVLVTSGSLIRELKLGNDEKLTD